MGFSALCASEFLRTWAALLIDFDYPWWHQTGDTLDKCSPESLEITGRVVLAALLDSPLPASP